MWWVLWVGAVCPKEKHEREKHRDQAFPRRRVRFSASPVVPAVALTGPRPQATRWSDTAAGRSLIGPLWRAAL
jgi:hypothetical protein